MNALPAPSGLTADAARALTEEVKADAAALWAKLLTLYEGGAHTALGYSSWGAYYEAEFGQSANYGYRLLASARVIEQLPNGNSTPPSEAVARELVPVLREQPERVAEVWSEVVEEHGPSPTAANVRSLVTRAQLANQSGGTDEWATPQDFFDVVAREFDFDLDVCALPSSAKCARYFTPEDDGLAQEWAGTCWMNPPYGDEIVQWVAKAYNATLAGATVVCLVPARTDTAWFHEYCFPGEVRFLRGRLRFGQAEASAPFPSALVVLGPDVTQIAFPWEWR